MRPPLPHSGNVWSLAIILVLLAAGCPHHCLASGSRHMLAATAAQQQQRQQKTSAVAPLLTDIYSFWLKNGVDKQYGGFHGTLDRQGKPISPTNKFTVQQARHLWAFSSLLTAQKSAGQTWGLNSKDVRAAADSAYSFMRKYMLRDVEGGKLFVYSTTREGQAANSDLNIYANSFAIYGLSAYALATGSTEVRELALSTFKTLDKLYHSPNGGYDETTSGCTLDSIALNPAQNSAVKSCSGTLGVSPSRASGSRVTEEAGSKQQQPPLSQSFNTLLHIAEALTELSKATGGSDPTVTARLLEVLQLQTGPMVIRPRTKGANTPAAYIAPNYDPRSWSPVGGFYTNYGHNIEAAWLLNDAVDELQAKGGIESAKAAAMRAVLTDIGEAAVAAGYDNTNGGLYDGSNVGAASPTQPNKVWWTQAEALLGFEFLDKQTGNAGYKTKLQQTLGFITQHLQDKQYGEWYWQTASAGGAPLSFNAGDVQWPATTKGLAWKASYHTGRSALRLVQAGY